MTATQTHPGAGPSALSSAPQLGSGPTLTQRTDAGILAMTTGPDALGLLLLITLDAQRILCRRADQNTRERARRALALSGQRLGRSA